jgi:hypothetical protein
MATLEDLFNGEETVDYWELSQRAIVADLPAKDFYAQIIQGKLSGTLEEIATPVVYSLKLIKEGDHGQ